MEKKWVAPGGDLTDAWWVRDQVFTIEQEFSPEIEVDDMDVLAHHVVFYEDGKPIATARTFPETGGNGGETYIIGRVAVLKEHRGGGMGKRLMDAMEEKARELGAKAVLLGAQCRAKGFYERCGYTDTGEPTYFEEYCEHVDMRKKLD
ncbi:MAG: GNAT family N-acetyltransferase [Oscillospiraceae bacterium]